MSTPSAPAVPRRSTAVAQKRGTFASKKPHSSESVSVSKSQNPNQLSVGAERTVKKLRLSKALTIPEGTSVSDACRRMSSRRVDAVLLTDVNALLSGIVTDKDIATRVIAEGLRPEQTVMSKIMTRNPIFVNADSLAIDALQKMVQGNFRHLPVVENGEVVALLDITKCLYDAISRVEKAAELDIAIAAAVEGVERQWGSNTAAPLAFIDALRERMFKPPLSRIIVENTKVAIVGASNPICVATQKMREFCVDYVIVMTGNKIHGILTSKDILMRVVAQNLSPELTLVEKVMTPNPEWATLETSILDALHIMQNGKFLHLPVIDREGYIAACLDVLQITHAALSMVETSSDAVNDTENMIMQRFWGSTWALEAPDDCDTQSYQSGVVTIDGFETRKSVYPSLSFGNSFAFKFEDLKGRVHRFNCGSENLDELLYAVMQRVNTDNDRGCLQILYEDDEGDKVILETNGDLLAAVTNAKSAGLKALRLHLDYPESCESSVRAVDMGSRRWVSGRTGMFAGVMLVAGVGVLLCLRRPKLWSSHV